MIECLCSALEKMVNDSYSSREEQGQRKVNSTTSSCKMPRIVRMSVAKI